MQIVIRSERFIPK